jgi:hypothetical protein
MTTQSNVLLLVERLEHMASEGWATQSEADAAVELRRLYEVNAVLLAALIQINDLHEDEPCRIDHHGFCQTHYFDNINDGGCCVANAKVAIAKATGKTP